MQKRKALAVIALTIAAVTLSTSANAHDRGERSRYKLAEATPMPTASLTAEQQAALAVFSTSVQTARDTRVAATTATRTAYLAAKASAKLTRDQALLTATTDAEKIAIWTAYKTAIRTAHDARKLADQSARAAFKAAIVQAKADYMAATGLSAPRIKS